MAKRPVFVPTKSLDTFLTEIMVDFYWNAGFSETQKKKNIIAMHEAARMKGLYPLLEVSTKSEDKLGRRLSAFNLKIETEIGPISIESAFQGSKVFENGGPYNDLYRADSRSAKTDNRIRHSGKLVGFNFFGTSWPIIPKTAFYDWIYLKALEEHSEFLKRLYDYKGFTDIEFNPQKSINCQARSCALLVSLLKLKKLKLSLSSQNEFIDTVAHSSIEQRYSNDLRQNSFAL